MTHESEPSRAADASLSTSQWKQLDEATLARLERFVEARVGNTLAGRFHLDRIIAVGGMAAVYEATQAPLMRQVAVKILHPTEVAAGRTDFFLREANAASNLRHPNIISIVDFGQESDGTLFLAMEYVPGLDFGELIEAQFPLGYERVFHIGEQICLALEVAHESGVIHCDMKPSNVMIESVPGNPDFVKVVDFGISKIVVDEDEDPNNGEIFGSFAFMAPEQLMRRPIVPATDVYGLGAVLYAALTGAMPFEANDDTKLIQTILRRPPVPPSSRRPEQDIPEAVDKVILRAMAKDPEERYPTASAMRRALLDALEEIKAAAESDANPLEILFPEDEFSALNLFDDSSGLPDWDLPDDFSLDPESVGFELDLSLDGEDAAALDALISPDADSMPPLELGPPIEHESEAPVLELTQSWDEGDASSAPMFELVNPIQPPQQANSAAFPQALSRSFSSSNLRAFAGSRQDAPPLIGREAQLDQLWQAAQRTRRGALAVSISGPYGIGRSFFLRRALALISDEFNAPILNCTLHPGDRERPYIALHQLIRSGLRALQQRGLVGEPSADPTASSERALLQTLELDDLELRTLNGLLARWLRAEPSPDDPTPPFDHTPLRYPETRSNLLRFAIDGLLRRLTGLLQRTLPVNRERIPVILSVDGWEHCDQASQNILRHIMREGRNLPLLLLINANPRNNPLTEEFPEDAQHTPQDSPGEPSWLDMRLTLQPLSVAQTRDLIAHLAETEPDEAFVQRAHALAHGNPLFVKELLHLIALTSSEASLQDLVSGAAPMTSELPLTLDQVFQSQMDALPRQGKRLLAVCAVVGLTFPKALIEAVLPDDFDLQSALDVLLQARLLEWTDADPPRLGFRIPQLRDTVLTRLQPSQARHLHTRIVETFRDAPISLPSGEAELWLATHMVRGGAPLEGIDHLLDAANVALNRWEPELAVRRFRQIQIWITRRLATLQNQAGNNILVLGAAPTPEHDAADNDGLTTDALEQRSIRATTGLFRAARRLLLHPKSHDAVIPERLPHLFLESLHSDAARSCSPPILAAAALEVGRYLSARGLPQSARTALQEAIAYARVDVPEPLIIEIELQLARTLHQLAKLGRATDLANDALQRIRSLGPAPPVARNSDHADQRLHISQPLDQLARLYIEQRQYPRAEHLLDQARAAAESDNELDLLHEIYLHYGHLYHARNQLPRTLQVLELSFETAAKAYNYRSQARTLFNLGITCVRSNYKTEARHYFTLASQIAIALAWSDFVALIDEQLRHLH